MVKYIRVPIIQVQRPSHALEMQALAMTLRHYEYVLLHKTNNVFLTMLS